jgi:prepilin-type N-terminal cleavage/methylation domain-containing protein
MKTFSVPTPLTRRARRAPLLRRLRAFTLVEMMIAVTIFTVLAGAIMLAHLFGLRMFQLTETKLTAVDGARRAVGKMANEIRTSQKLFIGNIKNGNFEALLDGDQQQGVGLMLYPTSDTNNYIIYFLNPSDSTFRRTTSTPGTASVVAQTITNTILFRAQDPGGNVLTNTGKRCVVHVDLEFQQQKKALRIADHYKLETAVTRRALR